MTKQVSKKRLQKHDATPADMDAAKVSTLNTIRLSWPDIRNMADMFTADVRDSLEQWPRNDDFFEIETLRRFRTLAANSNTREARLAVREALDRRWLDRKKGHGVEEIGEKRQVGKTPKDKNARLQRDLDEFIQQADKLPKKFERAVANREESDFEPFEQSSESPAGK
jgi:hypothetical protein